MFISKLKITFDTAAALEVIKNSNRWNSVALRTEATTSPHHQVDDIWAHYGSLKDPLVQYDLPFKFHWYYEELTPILKPIADALMVHVDGIQLGLILITRIPAGSRVLPHIDKGWHAKTFSKYCVCVQANKEQAFCFEGQELRTETGEVFWFDNSKSHWVNNDSDQDRISLIVCIKTDRGIHNA